MSARPETAIQLVRAAVRTAGLGQRTDAGLLADFLDRHDASAFEALVRRHGPLVLSACRNVLRDESAAEDAFQATFVALFRKAASIRDRPSLAGWLFRVARRTATSAHRADHRRAQREVATARRMTCEGPDLSWRDACAVLHNELDKLSDAYRLPLILCYLEGLSRDEAARRLGWSLNEIRGRLERGRLRLRVRLQKRGVTLSAGLLTVVTVRAVSADLISATTKAFHTSPARVVSPLTWPAGIGLAIAVALIVGVAVQYRDAQAQPTTAKAKPADPPAAKVDAPTVSGRVLDPDGKPVAGANVFVRPAGGKEPARVTVKTDADGQFALPVSNVPFDTSTTVAATADGFAAAWASFAGKPPGDLTLTLAKDDLPIRGRVLDLQGKAIAGVKARFVETIAIPDGGPKAYLQWTNRQRGTPTHNSISGAPPGATAEALTDAAGEFRLTGVGRDRVAVLLLSGPGIANEHLYAITVAELDPKPSGRSRRAFPAKFEIVALPARPIHGTVRDADTGKPVAGVRLVGLGGITEATTDKDGRYELLGYKKGPKYTIYAWPADGSTYLPGLAEVNDPAGLDPVTIDFTVRAGVQVTGRVRDTATDKPVAAIIRYYPLAGNPNVTAVSVGERPGDFFTLNVKTRPDGSFTCAALPGRGLLALTADSGRYTSARVDPKPFVESGSPPQDADRIWISVGGAAITSVSQESCQAIVFLNVDPKKPPGEQAIDLTPAEPVRGRLLDPNGKLLRGVRVRGLHQSEDDWSDPLGDAEFTAAPPHPDRPRRMSFRHDERKLVGTAVVAGGSVKPVDFKLEPWGTLTGRLVDADGKPVSSASIFAPAGRDADGKTVDNVRIGSVFADADGRFTIDGLLPGVAYELNFREFRPGRRGGVLTKEVQLKPGESKDLGDLKIP